MHGKKLDKSSGGKEGHNFEISKQKSGANRVP
jgi:hypothetical protein